MEISEIPKAASPTPEDLLNIPVLCIGDVFAADATKAARPETPYLETVVEMNGKQVKVLASTAALADPQVYFEMSSKMDPEQFNNTEPIVVIMPASQKEVRITDPKYKQALALVSSVITAPKWSDVEWAMFASAAGVNEFAKVIMLAMLASGLTKTQITSQKAAAKKNSRKSARRGASGTPAKPTSSEPQVKSSPT